MNCARQPRQTETTCPYCGVGCGVTATYSQPVDNSQQIPAVSITGTLHHPANQGRLCVKGASLADTLDHEGRLLAPQINGKTTDWETATDFVASQFSKIISEHGPDAVAFYLSGQLLTEDYYVANKLIKGFIGSANVDTNSRLCMSSAVTAHKRAFGADIVPGCYEDLEQADLLLLTGANTAWTHPVIYQRIVAAKQRRPEMTIVVIDPRRTATCDIADVHLAIAPGSDGFLFNGLLAHLVRTNNLDHEYINAHTEGFQSCLQHAMTTAPSLTDTARQCDIDEAPLSKVFDLFAATPRCVSLFSQGINQSSSGVDKANSIINCHLATGKIGKPGATPFSITGQPNAMGGREVGGLANQLAAHIDFSDPNAIQNVADFWQTKTIARQEGLKAIDMFSALHRGEIKAIWIMGTNPAVSMPNNNFVTEALKNCPLVVVSDCVASTDTTDCANVLLPATGWGEKDGTVTNSERMISRQRQFLPIPGEARHDWQIICDVADKMGFSDAFNFNNQASIFREHAALSGFRNSDKGKYRLFNISGLSRLSDTAYDNVTPRQWPTLNNPEYDQTPDSGSKRLFSNGVYVTPNNRARLTGISPQRPQASCSAEYPFMLNTGRIRDQWHTMTRTAKAPQLMTHTEEPFINLHPDDAATLELGFQSLALISNNYGSSIVRVVVNDDQQPGQAFMPIHWNQQYASRASVCSLFPAYSDPLSGQPELKQAAISIKPFAAAWYGSLISRNALTPPACEYWCKIPCNEGFRYMLAGSQQPDNWQSWLKESLQLSDDQLTMNSANNEHFRLASFNDHILETAFFTAPVSPALNYHWLQQQLGIKVKSSEQRQMILAGRPAIAGKDKGRILCSCFQVGENCIREALTAGCSNVEELTDKLKCGSNCGSCLPEIKHLVSHASERLSPVSS